MLKCLYMWDYQIILHMFNISFLLFSLHPCYSCTVCFLYCVTNYYRDSLHVVCLIPPKVDGWTEIQKDLEKHAGSQWFTVIFIFLGHFIFTNLFIGIIIMASIVLVLKKEYSSSSYIYVHRRFMNCMWHLNKQKNLIQGYYYYW